MKTSFGLRFAFGAGLLASVAFSGSAMAQSAPEAAETDAIVVTGTPIRDSHEAAIEAKRNADRVMDVISADTIGRFPDQNLADSLGRLPGVAIERDQGQARYVNFRGAPFQWTAIAFDGIDVPGAENGRIPRFDSFPSTITSTIEASKAITPDMSGEAVSGHINIKTFNPFDREGLAASLEAGYGEQELGGGPVNKYNARVSYSGDMIGVVAFGSQNRRVQNTDNREYELTVNAADQLIVNNVDFRSYFVERKDNAYGGSIEVRPGGPNLKRAFLSTLFSEFIDNEERNQFDIEIEDGRVRGGTPVVVGETGYQGLVEVTRSLEDGRYENSTSTHTLGADWDFDGWLVEGRLNLTTTESKTFLPIVQSSRGRVAASWDVTDILNPIVTIFNEGTRTPRSINGLTYTRGNVAILFADLLETTASKVKLDVAKEFGSTTVKVGAQFDTREGEGKGGFTAGGFPSSVNINNFTTGVPWYTDFNNTINATNFNNEGLRDAWERAAGGSFPFPDLPANTVAIDENILSAYAMATTDFGRGNVVYGARIERADYSSRAPAINVNVSDEFTHVLPSIHLNYDITDSLKARASLSSGISRPTYTDWRASATVNVVSQTVVGGNPTLKPEEAWGGDVSVEWYFAPASLLSAGVFHRQVDNVIYVDSTKVDGGIYLASAAGQQWTLSGPVNGRNGYLTGLEFNVIANTRDLLPGPLDGFGFTGNVTLLDSEFELNSGATFSLPGTSEVIYNASVSYENYGFSGQLNYSYRDDWLSTTENDSLAEFWGAQQRVDASIRYNLPFDVKGVRSSLFLNVNNITDEKDVRYVATPRTPNQYEGYGRYWLAGFRIDY